jgi:hypothetical protein
MEEGFQKVLKIKPPREFFTSLEAFVSEVIPCDHGRLQT